MEYDLLIIGAGPGGCHLAAAAVASGQKVAIFEKDLAGGTCLNRGCIPTKCLLASAEAAHAVTEAAKFGVEVQGLPQMHYDVAAARMNQVVDQLRQGQQGLIAGADYVHAAARIVSAKEGSLIEVEADGTVYKGRKLVIATGSRPSSLPIPGAEYALDSDQVLALSSVPASAVIIGGGVIGMEFACILNAFGTEVTVIEYCPEILPPFDAEVAKRLRTILGRQGIKIIVGAAVSGIAKDAESGRVTVAYQSKKGPMEAQADMAIMAVGRKAVLPEGCEQAGVEIDRRGCIVADNSMSTRVPNIYAIGDCNGKCMLAHAAEAQARVVMGEYVDLSVIPSAVFSMPECAMVGPTEQQCKDREVSYASGKAMYASNGKAQAMGQADGFVKVLFDPGCGRLLAVHAIGAHAVDIVAEAAACITLGATVQDVAQRMVHGHPTLSEMLMSACAVCVAKMKQ